MKKGIKLLEILNNTKICIVNKHPAFWINKKLITDSKLAKTNEVFAKLGTSSPIQLNKVTKSEHKLTSMGQLNWLNRNKNTKCTIAVYEKETQFRPIKNFTFSEKSLWFENPNFSTEKDFVQLVLLHLINTSNCILYESRIGPKEIFLPFKFKEGLVDIILNEKNYDFNKYSEEASDYIKSLIEVKQKEVTKNRESNNSIFQITKFNKNIKHLDSISSDQDSSDN